MEAVVFPDQTTMILFMWVFPILAVIFCALFFIWLILTPKPARTLFKARFSKKIPLIVCGEEGLISIKLGKPLPQGILEINKDTYILIPRRRHADKVEENPYEDLISKRHIFEGLNKPGYFVYHGKAVAVNPEVLANLEFSEEKGETLKPVTDAKVRFATLLDPRRLKEHLPKMVTDSQIMAIAWVNRRYGQKQVESKTTKMAISIGSIVLIVIIFYIVYAMFGGGMAA